MPDPKKDLSREDWLPDSVETYMGLPLSRKCSICRAGDDVVFQTNKMLVEGNTYKDILTEINKGVSKGSKHTIQTLKTHQEKHVPYKQKALRKIAEKNALAYRKDILKGEENFLTAAAFAEAIMQKGFASLAETDYIDYNDGLRAALALDKIRERDKDQEDKQQYIVQLNRIIQAVKESVPVEYHKKIIDHINNEPLSISNNDDNINPDNIEDNLLEETSIIPDDLEEDDLLEEEIDADLDDE